MCAPMGSQIESGYSKHAMRTLTRHQPLVVVYLVDDADDMSLLPLSLMSLKGAGVGGVAAGRVTAVLGSGAVACAGAASIPSSLLGEAFVLGDAGEEDIGNEDGFWRKVRNAVRRVKPDPASPVICLAPCVVVLKDLAALAADLDSCGHSCMSADAVLLGPVGAERTAVLIPPHSADHNNNVEWNNVGWLNDIAVVDDAGMDAPASAIFVAPPGAARGARAAATARAASIVAARTLATVQASTLPRVSAAPGTPGGLLWGGPRFLAIQLSNRPERVKHVDAMRRLLPSLEVVDAVDGASELDASALGSLVDSGFILPHSTDDIYVVPRRPFLVNNVAAFLSHRRALARVAEGSRIGVVLEDDIELLGDFLEGVSAATNAMLADPEGIEFVQLYVMPDQLAVVRPKAWTPRRPAGRRWTLIPKPQYAWGLHAYAVTPAGAAKIVSRMWPMLGAVDEQLPRLSGAGIAMHVLFRDDETGDAILKESECAPSVTNAAPRTVAALLKGAEPPRTPSQDCL